MHYKKSQAASEVFKYLLAAFISVVILFSGYKVINLISSRSCQADLARFEIDLRNLDKSLRYGDKEIKTFGVPCNVNRIYMLDLKKGINPNDFGPLSSHNVPVIKDSITPPNRAINNVFLVNDNEVDRAFDIGKIEIDFPGYLCLKPTSGKVSIFIEGAGETVRIALPPGQLLC